MSARLSRMSPGRGGSWIGFTSVPSSRFKASSISSSVIDRPLATLKTRPATLGASAARRLACTTLATKVKSRD